MSYMQYTALILLTNDISLPPPINPTPEQPLLCPRSPPPVWLEPNHTHPSPMHQCHTANCNHQIWERLFSRMDFPVCSHGGHNLLLNDFKTPFQLRIETSPVQNAMYCPCHKPLCLRATIRDGLGIQSGRAFWKRRLNHVHVVVFNGRVLKICLFISNIERGKRSKNTK